jgi:O-methyltransferase
MNNIDKFYTDVNIFFELEKIDFMNHGYYPTSSLLNDKNETFKNQKSLYLSLFKDVDTNNKVILDVGCGRGGGINTLDKYFNFKEIYACDVNEKNIQYCKNNNSSNINYKTLNALNLEYPDNFFDIVTNVESSHCYENPSLFFLEIK